MPHSVMKNTTAVTSYNAYIGGAVPIDRTCVVVTALCNQAEAFASYLGDDQSRYL